MMDRSDRFWSRVFWAAALFNFAIGAPLMVARDWAFDLAFYGDAASAGIAPDLWADFGFAVALIGAGYAVVACDVTRNRGFVWLGIAAKAFDVIVLTWRSAIGMTRPLALVPALIDAGFILLFVAFLARRRTVS